MARPIHFEIPAEKPESAIEFYSNVFGWRFQKWDGPMEYWMIMTGADPEPGINGGLLRRQFPNQPCVNTIGVTNLDESLKKVEGAGGKTAVPKMPVPGIGWLAYCTDPEGQMFGMMQMDPRLLEPELAGVRRGRIM